jgi:hypothetical protein
LDFERGRRFGLRLGRERLASRRKQAQRQT